jgi:hypothetical protein
MQSVKVGLKAAPVASLAILGLLALAWAAQAGAPAPAPAAAAPAAAPAPAPVPPAAAPAPAPAAPTGPGQAQPAQPKEAKPPVSRSIFDQEPYPAYEQSGRVDPFTLGKALDSERIGPDGGLKPIIKPENIYEEKLLKAQVEYAAAEGLLSSEKRERFGACLEACRRNLSELNQSIEEVKRNVAMARYQEPFNSMQERFQRLEATAVRLKQRQDIETEFAGLKIAVEGIVWSQNSPAAAVNGEVLTEGAVLPVGKAGQAVQVYRIRRDAVIFLYRGVQVKLERGGL